MARRRVILLSLVFPAFVRLSGAILIAFAGMVLVKSRPRPLPLWIGRAVVALALFVAALWIVFATFPAADPGMPVFSIVGSSVLIAGLAAEEFVGADIRRLLRM